MTDSSSLLPDDGATLDFGETSRRAFLLATAATLLAGCGETTKSARALPGPTWSDPQWTPTPKPYTPPPARQPAVVSSHLPAGVIPRSRWAKGNPVPGLMNQMTPVRYVTVHHDGMSPFTSTNEGAAAARLESIRRGHRGKPQPWGDIGYHFAVDPAGRVWECRPLNWQGAHVKHHNPGNIGIVCLGNYERQTPNSAQLQGIQRIASTMMRNYRVPAGNLKTHREWAATACPGRYLQGRITSMRSNRAFV